MPTPVKHDLLKSARRAARAEAAAWIVRLHGAHRSPDLEAGFHRWLHESPENSRQFERATEVWEAGATVPTAGMPRTAQWKTTRNALPWAVAAALALVVSLGSIFSYRHWSTPTYNTDIGEQRSIRLGDGTRLLLNSATTVSVAFTQHERRINLNKGEAYFEVAQEAARSFVVIAGHARVTALGTVFTVRYEQHRTAVTLLEGKVSIVAPADRTSKASDRNTVILSPGERVTYSNKAAPKLDEPALDATTAWRRGEVVLDKTPLPEAVAEMNRYEKTQLVIDDAKTAGLRISGVYHAGDSENFARNVAELYGLEIRRERGSIGLHARR